MTDEQIIKALKRCFTRGFDESDCYECPFYTATAKCTEDLRDSVLDFINRQKAEIERYKGVIKILENDVANAKYEAIKEFAERLKEKFGIADCIVTVDSNDIDDLVKEMEEES